MAQNLYEYSPSAAVDFITKMARNDNPSIRTNIVQALSNIAKPETFELLFELYEDNDPRVKREVLRNLKMLNQKISAGSVNFSAQIADKIKSLINKEKDRGEWIF
jgi:HEAT repeat protein